MTNRYPKLGTVSAGLDRRKDKQLVKRKQREEESDGRKGVRRKNRERQADGRTDGNRDRGD